MSGLNYYAKIQGHKKNILSYITSLKNLLQVENKKAT